MILWIELCGGGPDLGYVTARTESSDSFQIDKKAAIIHSHHFLLE